VWNNGKTGKALVLVVCLLAVSLAGCGSETGSHEGSTTTSAVSRAYLASSTGLGTMHTLSTTKTNAAAFRVTSIDVSVTPSNISLWRCGSYIQVVYNAVFHVVSGPNGGTIVFSYTLNNGRSQTPERLTILPGQRMSNFTFTWQGSLPSDHTYPGRGGVAVTSPNSLVSPLVAPAGECR
jgi:hypothetical protein